MYTFIAIIISHKEIIFIQPQGIKTDYPHTKKHGKMEVTKIYLYFSHQSIFPVGPDTHLVARGWPPDPTHNIKHFQHTQLLHTHHPTPTTTTTKSTSRSVLAKSKSGTDHNSNHKTSRETLPAACT